MNKKNAWVLVNVGSPASPGKRDVRKYLREFLGDPYVIDLPYIARKVLVNLVIVPFRAPRSAAKYRRIWTREGSPLLKHSYALADKLQKHAGDEADVVACMRYESPSLERWIHEHAVRYEQVNFLPLYPHFSFSTTRTVETLVQEAMNSLAAPPSYSIIKQFWNHPNYLEVLAGHIASASPRSFDHVVFTYHGLPERQVHASHPQRRVSECNCHLSMPDDGCFCYRATCFATSRELIKRLGLNKDQVTTGFQSRLSKNWLKPFTDKILRDLARRGERKVLIVPLSFVADNLETLEELNLEYRELFLASGGKEAFVLPALNDNDAWASAAAKIIRQE